MRQHRDLAIGFLILAGLAAGGCSGPGGPGATSGTGAATARTPAKPAEVRVVRTAAPTTIDGRMDEPAWATAPAYPLGLTANLVANGKTLAERGSVKFLWDDEYLYMGVEFEDSDVVAEGEEDGLHHYQMGDLAELFLWPEDRTWYWELYVTPAGKQTTFFFPGPGRLGLPSGFKQGFRMKVAAQVDGTLNNWEDRDRRWVGEMAVPVKELTAKGESWGPGSSWRVLVGRYNYSRYLSGVENSCMPQLSGGSFHLRNDYGRLVFDSAPAAAPATSDAKR